MAENVLSGEVREGLGKGVARKLRAAGRIPAVFYGKGKGGTSLAVDPRELERVLHASGSGMNTLINLAVSGQTTTVLVKELQREPVRGGYLHADFYAVDMTSEVQVDVPIHFVGKAKGIEFGGILDHPVREVEVECLPQAIPDAIEVDVTELQIGDSIHVRELVVPEGVRILTEGDLSVAMVVPPTAEEEAPAAAEVEGEVAAAEGEAADDEKKEEGGKEGAD